MAKKNWDFMAKRKTSDTKYRDVYEDQQLERGKLQQKQGKTSRVVFCVVMSLIIGFVAYFVASVFMPLFKSISILEDTVTATSSVKTSGSATVTVSGETSTVTVQTESIVYHNYALKPKGVDFQLVDADTGDIVDVWDYTDAGIGFYYTCVNHEGFQPQTLDEIKNLYDEGFNFIGVIAVETAPSETTSAETSAGETNASTVASSATKERAFKKVGSLDMNGYRVYDVATGDTIDLWKYVSVPNGNYYFECENHPGYKPEVDGIRGLYDENLIFVGVNAPVSGESTSSAKSSSGGLPFDIDMTPSVGKLLFAFIIAAIFFGIMYTAMMRNLEAQNMLSDTSDINQYQNDQHIALPEELQRRFDWFPDVGATSSVQFSSMISHMALSNKGIKKVPLAKRADKDIFDEDGDIQYYKGEIILDENDKPITSTVEFFDKAFMESLFEASAPDDDTHSIRKYYDATKIPYNPNGKNRLKAGAYNTVADFINADWELPYYEPQRPGGAYLVDVEPVNTMVLAITRAGKGQTYIEPTLDMWMRERKQSNMVINDPKGELLVKNYVRATVRGYQVVQFNLINAMKTDIFNPLGMASDAAREGEETKVSEYVSNIADVFFPVKGSEDPVWPNAANNAFKRAAYGLIDYFLEEEKELRLFAEKTKMDPVILDTKLDEMWGKVTLYNTYQLFVQLSAKKMKNPSVEFSQKAKAGAYETLSNEEYNVLLNKVEKQSLLWEDKQELDLLTLFFNATEQLPRNSIRRLAGDANNALRSMSGAEKMIASVYGIAITALSFFTDPTISTLTSGTPSQNVDLGGLCFPRRFGVRFHADFVSKFALKGMQAKWMTYEDNTFTKEMGADFYHEDMITREGWAKYYFYGKFPNEVAYIKLSIVNPQTGMLILALYFQFKKAFQTSLDGRKYVTDPILGNKIIKNGILTELKPKKNKDGNIVYEKARTTFEQDKIVDILGDAERGKVRTRAIILTTVRYSEKPKIVFLVTPPHLMKYAKLVLVLLRQLVDLNFEKSYMTKPNQKPLYKTRFMLDEVGNLQSDGEGIQNFSTLLSIGLGQDQQFTLILQTLQQLRDVYGDSVDRIVQGNTSNIVFLKSTDDSMLDTLEKMSGKTHKSFTNSKSITRDMTTVFRGLSANEGKVSYTMSLQELPVISYNDMAFISERNSMVFRAGDSPVWNRNETILPMSYKLFENTITQPGKTYSLQTIPTLASAVDFDVRKNQPDFRKMLDKRMNQAFQAQDAKDLYQSAYELTDFEIAQMDPESYSDEIMAIINEYNRQEQDAPDDDFDYAIEGDADLWSQAEDNPEQVMATAEAADRARSYTEMKFAGGLISPDMLASGLLVYRSLEKDIISVYTEIKGDMWRDTDTFTVVNGNLCGLDGTPYIVCSYESETLKALNSASEDEKTRVFSEGAVKASDLSSFGTYTVTDDFYRFLAGLPAWTFANGKFDAAMRRRIEEE